MSSSLSSVNMSPDKLRLMASGLTNARKDYDQKWDATLTSLDTLKQAIAKCRAQVKENPSKTKQLLKSTNKAAKRAAKTVSREHKVGYQALSKYSDFVDQSFVSGTTVSSLANPDAFEDVTDSVQRIIAEHFALEGLFDASQAFYEETGVGSTESLDQFRSFHHITDALHKQNIAPFERWLHENMGRLSGAAASKMMLHYVKHRFVHMIAHNQTTEALAFAHQHMAPLYIEHSEEVKRVMCAVIHGQDVQRHPDFEFYFSTDAWTVLAHAFTQTACALMGVQETSPLALCVSAGCAGVPVLLKWETVAKATGRQTKWYDDDVVPVQVPVNQDKQCHSVFVCPVSKEIAQESNPPVLLKCGHAMCKSSAQRLSEGRLMACPYCPRRMHARELVEMHF